MKKILSFVFLMFLFFCSKSDSSDVISSEENNSNLPETFGNWSPDFTNQTTNFNQTRTGSKGTNETREITVTGSDEVLLSIESKLLTDINEDGDNFDITSQTITTFTASEGLGSFISSGTTLIKSDINIELKNAGQVDVDITSISTGEVLINANPSDGYRFLGWDGISISTPTSVNPLSMDIESDNNIKANFLNINDPDYSGIGFYADPIYSQIDPNNLYSYLDVFILDAKRYGVDLSYVHEGCANMILDPNFTGAAGASFGGCIDNQVRIKINKTYWEEQFQILMSRPYANPLYSDTTIYGFHLIWHELCHDILYIDHNCYETPNFLNHFAGCGQDSGVNLQYTSDMLWFTDDSKPDTSQQNRGFHTAVSNYYRKVNQVITNQSSTGCDCPLPETCIRTFCSSGWSRTQNWGSETYTTNWCQTLDRINVNYSEEYVGSCPGKNLVFYTNNNELICEGVPL